MNNMFGLCKALTSINVSSFNTSNVTDMGGMFQTCDALTSLDVSGFNTSSVTNMSSMFSGCNALTSLDVSSFNTSSVTDMSSMFCDCSKLVTVFVSDKWNTNNVTSSTDMFSDCKKLIGGEGTEFDTSHTDKEYARIDNAPDSPGYLTDKEKGAYVPPYVELSGDGTTLTFYRDGYRDIRAGTCFSLNSGSDYPEWYSSRGTITSVVFDESFASARPKSTAYWFFAMGNLTTITGMEFLNTSEVTNMSHMFYQYNQNLTTIDVSHFDTKNVTTMEGMFGGGLIALTNLDLSSFNTSNVTNMSLMFYSCTALTSLDLSSFDTQEVTDMSIMFNSCTALQTITVGIGWNTDNVTNSSSMFTYCNDLIGGMGTTYNGGHVDKEYAHVDGGTEDPGYLWILKEAYAVYIKSTSTLTFYYDSNRASRTGTVYDLNTGSTNPGWYTYRTSITNVVFDESFAAARPTTTYRWFYSMTNLTTITGMEYLNTSEVTNMSHMFYGCTGLTLLDLHNFNTANVTTMDYMFYNCTGLLTIYVGEGWSTEKVTSSSNMFRNCTKLRGGAGTGYSGNYITADYAHVDSDDDPGYFTEFGAIEAYAVFNGNNTLIFYYDDQKIKRSLISRYTVYNLNTDGTPGWYDNHASITMVIFDASFADARPTSTYGWFMGMTRLTNKTTSTTGRISNIKYLNTSAVTNMSRMFSGCTGLTSLDVSGFDTENVTDMSFMFYNCALTTLDVSGFNTGNVTNMNSMFYGCSKLATIYCNDDWNTGTVTSSANMFNGCTVLVGGNGTEYDESNVDATYAHPDVAGNPGYFTRKFLLGDVNNDGSITIADVTALVNIILGKDTAGTYNHNAADVNQDLSITIADVTALVNIILGK